MIVEPAADEVTTSVGVQRRAFVRITVSRPMTLAVVGETGTLEHYRGILVDVSESALRCLLRLDPQLAAERLAADRPVLSSFTVGATDFSLPGLIRQRDIADSPDAGVQRVVIFDQPVAPASVLRREIFAEQIRQHRLTAQRTPR